MPELFDKRSLWHETVRAKLDGLLQTPQFDNFSKCGAESLIRTCRCCGKTTFLDYQCSIKWCPRCQWKIAESRAKLVSLWAARVKQPKHLVLTESNHQTLTKTLLQNHLVRIRKFRRTKCFKQVRGGCVSVELTNESRGWHLHSHWLVDVDWLEPAEIAKTWGALAGQNYAIVKVKDARPLDYQKQVAKYVVKPAQLASWPPHEIHQFILAIHRRRFFFKFGSLLKATPEILRLLKLSKQPTMCECGNSQWTVESEVNSIFRECSRT